MWKNLVAIFLVLGGLSSVAQEAKKQETAEQSLSLNFAAADFKGIELVAKQVMFRYLGSSENHQVKVKSYQGLELQRQRENGILKLSWPEALENRVLLVYYSGPATQLKVISDSLKADIKKWEAEELDIRTRNISFLGSENKGNIKIKADRGAVSLLKHKGNFRLDAYGVKLKTEQIEGDLEVKNFAGEWSANDLKGAVVATLNKGSLELSKMEGNLEVKSHSADVITREVDGRIRGNSKIGSWKLFLEKDNRIRLRSGEAKVNIYMPSGSGSHINIGSQDGDLRFPKYLELKRYPSIKVATGRLRGRLGGSVYVRSTKGDIRLIQR